GEGSWLRRSAGQLIKRRENTLPTYQAKDQRHSRTTNPALSIRAHARRGSGGIICGGDKNPRVPSPPNRGAAHFDSLQINYVGMPMGAAGKKWTAPTASASPDIPTT